MEQYERWKDFSLRMARTCFKHRRYPTWREIESHVSGFFDGIEFSDYEELEYIIDWDHSDSEKEEHYCVSDMCTMAAEEWNPYYWSASDETWAERDEQYCGPVCCCIRAGLDMAVSPSAGVLGFTAGDVRKMYPEGVPEWITGGPNYRWSYWLTDKLNGTFADMPDEMGLVL